MYQHSWPNSYKGDSQNIENEAKITLKQSKHSRFTANFIFQLLETIIVSGTAFIYWAFLTRFYSPSEVGLYALIASGIGLSIIISQLGGTYVIVNNYGVNPLLALSKGSVVLRYAIALHTIFETIIFAYYMFVSGLYKVLGLFEIIITYLASIILGIAQIFSYLARVLALLENRARLLLLKVIISFFGHFIAVGVILIFKPTIILMISIITIVFLLSLLPFSSLKEVKVLLISLRHVERNQNVDITGEAIGNHAVYFLIGSPTYLFQPLVLLLYGAEAIAYVHIAYMVSTYYLAFSYSATSSYYAELAHKSGSNTPGKDTRVRRKVVSLLLLLWFGFTGGFLLLGPWFLLMVFDAQYSRKCYYPVLIFLIGHLFYIISALYEAQWRIAGRLWPLILITSFIPVLFVGFTVLGKFMTISYLSAPLGYLEMTIVYFITIVICSRISQIGKEIRSNTIMLQPI